MRPINDDRSLAVSPQHQELAVGDTGRVVASVVGLENRWEFAAEDTALVRLLPIDDHAVEVVAKAPGTTRVGARVVADTTLSASVSVTVTPP